MFRVTRPYWLQQQQFHTQLIGALRRLLAAIRYQEQDQEQARNVLDELRLAQERRTEALEAGMGRLENVLEAGVGKLTQKFVVSTRELMKVDNERRSTLERRIGTLEAQVGRLENAYKEFRATQDRRASTDERDE